MEIPLCLASLLMAVVTAVVIITKLKVATAALVVEVEDQPVLEAVDQPSNQTRAMAILVLRLAGAVGVVEVLVAVLVAPPQESLVVPAIQVPSQVAP